MHSSTSESRPLPLSDKKKGCEGFVVGLFKVEWRIVSAKEAAATAHGRLLCSRLPTIALIKFDVIAISSFLDFVGILKGDECHLELEVITFVTSSYGCQ